MFFWDDRSLGMQSGNVYKQLGLKWLLHARDKLSLARLWLLRLNYYSIMFENDLS